MANSLALDTDPTSPTFWDLALVPTAGGLSLTVSTGAAALAQNVATALDTFLGEVWYDTAFGMPYLQQMLGTGRVPLAFIKTRILTIAQGVAGVTSATVALTGPTDRTLGGQVQIQGAGPPMVTVLSTNLAGALPWYVSAAQIDPSGQQLTGGGFQLSGGGIPLTGGGNP